MKLNLAIRLEELQSTFPQEPLLKFLNVDILKLLDYLRVLNVDSVLCHFP